MTWSLVEEERRVELEAAAVTRWTEKEIKQVLTMFMAAEKGKGISDLDQSYKRGWRDCIRGLRQHFKENSKNAPTIILQKQR